MKTICTVNDSDGFLFISKKLYNIVHNKEFLSRHLFNYQILKIGLIYIVN